MKYILGEYKTLCIHGIGVNPIDGQSYASLVIGLRENHYDYSGDLAFKHISNEPNDPDADEHFFKHPDSTNLVFRELKSIDLMINELKVLRENFKKSLK